jgi:hypothetical protein
MVASRPISSEGPSWIDLEFFSKVGGTTTASLEFKALILRWGILSRNLLHVIRVISCEFFL